MEEREEEEEVSTWLSVVQTHLSQHSEAGWVQLRLLQFHYPDPAVLIEVLLIVTVAQSKRVHLDEKKDKGQDE